MGIRAVIGSLAFAAACLLAVSDAGAATCTINNGAEFTNDIDVTVSFSPYSASEYRISNSSQFYGPYATWYAVPALQRSLAWSLVSYATGTVSVHMQFREGPTDSRPVTCMDSITVDFQPPTTKLSGLPTTCVENASLTLAASDSIGSGVAYTEYRIDRASWTRYSGSPIRLSAPAGARHTYVVDYRSADVAGNVEADKTCSVDTASAGPVRTKAPSAVVARRGGTATIRYQVNEAVLGGFARVTIAIENRAGRVVKTLRVASAPMNAPQSARFTCSLARGRYRFYVSAVSSSGARSINTASNRLTVR
jgi:hypothetical protein